MCLSLIKAEQGLLEQMPQTQRERDLANNNKINLITLKPVKTHLRRHYESITPGCNYLVSSCIGL